MSKIFLTGDTHASHDIQKLTSKNWPEGSNLTKEDVLIILGDFGLLWSSHRTKEEEHFLHWLDDKPWTTCVVDGNHENFDLIDHLPPTWRFGNEVGIIGRNIFHLKRGNLYRINKRKVLAIGGADSIDKAYRTEGKSWWPQETITDKDIRKAKDSVEEAMFQVDVVVTHCAPSDIGLIACPTNYKHMFQPSVSEQQLSWFLESSGLSFDSWFFGHYHTDTSIAYRKFYCLYNKVMELDDVL
jgi:hypothetical protein